MKLVGIKAERKIACESAMKKFNVKLVWDFAYEEKGNRRVPVECRDCGFCCTRTISDIQLGKYFCFGCYSKQLDDYAIKWNFTLLSFDKNKILCKCNTCFTQKFHSISGTYNSGMSCDTCIDNKYRAFAEQRNFKYIGRSRKEQLITLECQLCNTSRTVGPSGLRDSSVVCLTCKLENKITTMNPEGFTVISSNCQGRVILSCDTCGYWKNSTFNAVTNHNLVCVKCRENKYVESLLTKNCTFLNKAGRKIKFKLPNGEEREADLSSTLSGKFSTSDENHWENITSVYLIELGTNGNKYCKIGTAGVPANRMKELQLVGESFLRVLATFENRWQADELEKSLHRAFKKFSISPDLAKTFSKRKIREDKIDGVTEWFTSDIINKISETLDGLNRYTKS